MQNWIAGDGGQTEELIRLRAEVARRSQVEAELRLEMIEHQRAAAEAEAALQALAGSEERFRTLAEASFEGIAVTRDGIMIEANEQFARMHGYNLAEVLGRPAIQFVAPQDHGRVRRALAGAEEKIAEYHDVRKDGSAFVVEAHGRAVPRQGGRVRVTVLRDVSAQKQAAAERDAYRAGLDRLFRLSQQVLAEPTVERLLQRAVDAACELTGARVGITGQGYRDGTFVARAFRTAPGEFAGVPGGEFKMERGGVYVEPIETGNTLRLTSDQIERHPRWWGLPPGHAPLRGLLAAPLMGLDGRANGLIMVTHRCEGEFTAEDELLLGQLAALLSAAMHHIDARRAAEQRTAELETVLEAIPDAVTIYGTGGELSRTNRAGEQLFRVLQVDARAPLGERVRAYRLSWPDGRPVSAEDTPLAGALRGETVRGEVMAMHPAGPGAPLWMAFSAAPLFGPQADRDRRGAPVAGAVVSSVDITELRGIQERLQQANDTLEARGEELAVQAEELQARNVELTELSGELERRVEERTAALQEANASLHAEEENARRQAAHAQALAAVAARLSASLDVATVLHTVCDETARVLGLPGVGAGLYDEVSGAFQHMVGPNLPAEFLARLHPMSRAHYEDIVRRSGPVLVVEDARTLAGTHNGALYAEFNIRSLVGCGIVLGGQPIGGLNIFCFDEPRRFSGDELALLRGLADQAALAIANARLYEQLGRARDELETRVQERTRELQTVLDLSSHITSTLALEPMLAVFADHLRTIVECSTMTIFRLDGDDVVVIEYQGPVERAEALGARLSLAHAAGLARVVARREPLIVPDAAGYPSNIGDWQATVPAAVQRMAGAARSWLGVPLMVRDRVIGVARLTHDAPNRFTARDAGLVLAFANHAAVALENARLYGQARELAAVQERQRLARDLHDAVSQTLFSASLTADVLPRLYAQNPAHGQVLLDQLRRMNRGALAEMRTLLAELRPQALLEVDLAALLRQLADAAGAWTETPVVIEATGACRVPDDVQVAMYRVAQEALHNVARHAHAGHAAVSLACAPGEGGLAKRVELCVADDGCGFDLEHLPANHFGLSIMAERTRAVGAMLTIDSHPGAGTRITAAWPAPRA